MGKFLLAFLKFIGCKNETLDKLFHSDFRKMIEAINAGNLERIKYYHRVKKLDFNQQVENGENPLHIAAQHNQSEILVYLIDNIHTLNIAE